MLAPGIPLILDPIHAYDVATRATPEMLAAGKASGAAAQQRGEVLSSESWLGTVDSGDWVGYSHKLRRLVFLGDGFLVLDWMDLPYIH